MALAHKIDRLPAEEREQLKLELPHAIQLCAHDAADGRDLRERIVRFFDDALLIVTVTLPYSAQGTLAELRGSLRVLSESYDDVITVTVQGTPEVLGRLRKRLV